MTNDETAQEIVRKVLNPYGLENAIVLALKFVEQQAMIESCKAVCSMCAGHCPQFNDQPEGPNEAGNYCHEGYLGSVTSICKATGILVLLNWKGYKKIAQEDSEIGG